MAAIAVAALLVMSGEAGACVVRLYGPNNADTLGFEAGPGVSEDWIESAIGYWEVCPEGGFPVLSCGVSGDYTFTVAMITGRSVGSGCGSFSPDVDWNGSSWIVTGGSVFLYTHDGFGFPCSNTATARARTLAHEIGHVLGLDESSCTNRVMGGSSAVQSDECLWVAGNWTTEAEQQQQACEANCPYPCTGSPPVCDTTIDTGGGYQCSFSQCSPLVLDLNGDGIHTTSVEQPVSFDLTGDGVPEHLGWTDPETDEAFLWLDLHPNGRVDDGSELFGHGTVLEDGRLASDGFEALARYDRTSSGGNGDGWISAADRVWNRLRLWVDADHDGVCVGPESGPIAAYGVVAIPLTYTVHEEVDPSGNVHRLRGSYLRMERGNGLPRLRQFVLHDVFFRSLPPE
ncbi:MAG TPA: hypothetical protein VF432_24465 [Thermoanaerobaculia bacterium]